MKVDGKRLLLIVLFWIVIRVVLGIWMWGIGSILHNTAPAALLDSYKGVMLETNPWLEPWQRWDTPQYQAIAERGYTAFDTALFTPPLYPLMMRLAAPLVGGNTLLAGLVISGIASLFCLVMIERMTRFELGDQSDSMRTVLYLISFPTAFFFFAAYTESLFLLAVVASLFAARRAKWIQAGIWGAVAALTRAPGLLISIPLAYAAWNAWKGGDRKGWLGPVITLLGASLFPIYAWFGLRLPPTAILAAVGRGGQLAFPGWNIVEAILRILRGQLVEENLIELAFTLLFICLTFLVWKKLPRLYAIYALTFMALFLTRLGTPQPLVSMARYVLEIFPAFLILVIWGRKPWINRLILYISWLGLLFFSAQFAIWGWVG
jgi:hypothetical protein